MKTAYLALAIMMAATSAMAATASFDAALPFKVRLGKVSEVERGGLTYTVVEATIANGSHFLNRLNVQCEARNAGDFTWDVTGEVAALSPNEERRFKLLSSNGDDSGYYGKPTKITCAVKAFELGLI